MPSPVTNGRWTGNNETATAVCNRGYWLSSGDQVLNCPDGIWVGALPICSKISFGCASMPSPVINGRWTGNNETATVICSNGYELTSGEQVLNCSNGYWVGTLPLCSKVGFGCANTPPPVTNGRWTGNNVTAIVICNSGYELLSGDQTLNCPDVSFGCASMPSPVTNGRWAGNNVTATVICYEGYVLSNGEETLHCPDGTWIGVHPVCSKASFGCTNMPSPITNGRWAGTNVTATVICDDGYRFSSGDQILNCPDGIWVGVLPICSKTSFGCASLPSLVTNGRWTGNNVTATVICNDGYKLSSGDDTLNCAANVWVGDFPVCSKVSFGCSNMPSPVANGRWTKDNITANIICDSSYELTSGNQVLNCLDGIWAGALPVCSKKSFGCTDPPPTILNGNWHGNNVTVTYRCDLNHVIISGDEILNCPHGSWEGTAPVCYQGIIGCANPPPQVRKGLWEGNNMFVTIRCIEGYELKSGDETLICGNNQWIGKIPVCAAKIENECSTPPPQVLNGRWIGDNIYVKLACNDGYFFAKGDNTLECYNHSWIGEIPSCNISVPEADNFLGVPESDDLLGVLEPDDQRELCFIWKRC
ncbi:CUB and sushi domain-containing protein 3-like [Watersipora subatra]|uniref:CUB and sushi domain-containing protein 3-like n=1 Tax=Watersipora subatra TaxID=2589382 RepID=UPI00355BB76F